MVSLGRENRPSGGGYSFGVDGLYDETDEASLVSSVLVSGEQPNFKIIPITGVITLEILSTIALVIASYIVPLYLKNDSCFILSCTHACYWSLLFITSGYRNYHHNYLQRCGYLEFFRNTQLLQRIPLILPSLGNVLLIVLLAVFQKYCPNPDKCQARDILSCHDYLQIMFTVEGLTLFLCLTRYLVLVVKFNRSKAIPDIHQDELLISCLQSYAPPNEIGFRDEDYMEEVLEKQADMIRYLKQHSNNLSRKVLKLTSQIENAGFAAA